jgi:hypothetical protein
MQQPRAFIGVFCINVQQLGFNTLRLSFEKRHFKRVRSINVMREFMLLTIVAFQPKPSAILLAAAAHKRGVQAKIGEVQGVK